MLPELLINSPVPGVREKITTLKVELSEVGLELEIEAAELPAGLRKAGQFRVLIGSEIILCEAKEEKTKKVKILERGAEGSIKAAHAAGSAIYQIITAEGLKRYIGLERLCTNLHGRVQQRNRTGLGRSLVQQSRRKRNDENPRLVP